MWTHYDKVGAICNVDYFPFNVDDSFTSNEHIKYVVVIDSARTPAHIIARWPQIAAIVIVGPMPLYVRR